MNSSIALYSNEFDIWSFGIQISNVSILLQQPFKNWTYNLQLFAFISGKNNEYVYLNLSSVQVKIWTLVKKVFFS